MDLRVLGAALILWAAPAASAASIDNRGATEIEAWQDELDRPEEFHRAADGSVEGKGGPADAPTVTAREPQGSRHSPALKTSEAAPRTPRPAPPIPAGYRPMQRESIPDGLPVIGLGAGLGLVLGLLGLRSMKEEALPLPAVRPEPLIEAPAPPRPVFAPRTPPPAVKPQRDWLLSDLRMPRPTWRAISAREQKLIERWDMSPEKARGLASLEEWLDLKASAEGVDIPLLKAKLHRDV